MNARITNMCMIQDPITQQVVVQHRTKNWQGLVFPGGHVEKGESIHDSVIREIKEETGLDIQQIVLCGVKDYVDYEGNLQVVLCYRTQTFRGELIQSENEDDVSWIELSALNDNNTPSGFLDMLPLFLSDRTECYYTLEGHNILY